MSYLTFPDLGNPPVQTAPQILSSTLPFIQPDVLITGFALCLPVLSAAEFTERPLGVREEDGLWNTPERA